MGWPKGKPRKRPHPTLDAVSAEQNADVQRVAQASPDALAPPASGDSFLDAEQDMLDVGLEPVHEAWNIPDPEIRRPRGPDVLMRLPDGRITEVHRNSVATVEALGWKRYGSGD